MRKNILKLTLVFLSLLAALAFQAFTADEPIKIGLSLGNADSDRWLKDRAIFEKTVTQIGGKVLVQIANSDTSNQVEQAKYLISQGVKVLVIVPANAEKAATIVDLAHKAGIKVIAYDRLIKNVDLDYYISYDSEKVGELQAHHLIKEKPTGNYMIMSGPESDNNSILIKKGQMKVLAPLISKGSVKLIFDQSVKGWSAREAFVVLDKFLSENKQKPDAILAANDDLANGIIKALQKYNLNGKVLVAGQDADLEACKHINAGNQTVTIYKPIKPLAYSAAIAAMSLAKNEPVNDARDSVFNGKVKVPSVILTPFSIDLNTIRNVVIDGHLKEEDIFK